MRRKYIFLSMFFLVLLHSALPCAGAVAAEDFIALCEQGSPKQVGIAIKKRANVNARDGYGRSPLTALAGLDRPEIVRLLIEAGADVNERDEEGVTVLMRHASENESAESAILLVKAGADVNAHDNEGITVLIHAIGSLANFGDPALVPVLIAHGARVNDADLRGNTALQHASRYVNNLEFINALLKAGAAPNLKNNSGATPLMAAASTSDSQTVQRFLDLGLSVREKDEQGFDALMHACMTSDDPEVFDILLKAGATTDIRDDEGVTPLMLASTSPNASPEILKLLVRAGADVNAVCKAGKTPLIYAAEVTYSPSVLTALLEMGANPSTKDNTGKSALEYAVANERSEEVVSILRNAHASAYEPLNYRKAMFEDYEKGHKVRVVGEVSQILDGDGIVILHTRRIQHLGFMEDKVCVKVNGKIRTIEGDIFIAYGVYNGLMKRENVLGKTLSMPYIEAVEYEARERNVQDHLTERIIDSFNW